MQDTAIEDLLDVKGEPVLYDEHGLPVEREVSGLQGGLMWLLEQTLRAHRDREGLRWHVQANDPVHYYVQDQKERTVEKAILPDLYVVVGLDQKPAGPLRTWTDPAHQLAVVVELSSKRSLPKDLGPKRALYRDVLRVPEYFVFDVHQVKVEDQLVGFRLDHQGDYLEIPRLSGRGAPVRFHCEGLGLDLGVVDDPSVEGSRALRAFVPGSPVPLATVEVEQLREALHEKDEALREKDEALREKAEEIARLRAELRRGEEGPSA